MNKHDQLNLFEIHKEKKNPKLWYKQSFLSIDVETTGLNKTKDRIIEIAWIIFCKGSVIAEKSYLCSVEEPIPTIITKITGISNKMLEGKLNFSSYVDELLMDMKKTSFFVAYNASFDVGFINEEFNRLDKKLPLKPWIDPFVFIKRFDRYKKGKKLTDATARWGIKLDNAHRALSDAKATGQLLYLLKDQINCHNLDMLYEKQKKWKLEQDENYKNYIKRRNYK